MEQILSVVCSSRYAALIRELRSKIADGLEYEQILLVVCIFYA